MDRAGEVRRVVDVTMTAAGQNATSPNRTLSAALAAAAALFLGLAIQMRDGMISPLALVWLSVALGLMITSLFTPSIAPVERLGDRVVVLVLGASLIVQFVVLFVSPPGAFTIMSSPWEATFQVGLGAAALATTAIYMVPRATTLPIVVLIAGFLTAGVAVIHTSPSPPIDVFVFQEQSSDALLHGRNPYAESFPDIYGTPGPYGPGLSVGGQLMFGFPYPPLSLLLALPGHALLGDYRYSQLAAMAIAAVLMIAVSPTRISSLAAALFLFTPRSFFVLEQGWTEPFCVLLVSATAFAVSHRPRAWPYLLGLAVAVKQYMLFALPAALILVGATAVDWRRARSVFGRACLVALGITLPFALVDVPAFIKSVVTLHFLQPFRRDALSYLVAIAGADGAAPSSIWTLLACLAGLAIAMWRSPRTLSGFATVLALGSVSFFAFSKQGFCNYYYFTIGMLCLAVAAANVRGLTPNSARNA